MCNKVQFAEDQCFLGVYGIDLWAQVSIDKEAMAH